MLIGVARMFIRRRQRRDDDATGRAVARHDDRFGGAPAVQPGGSTTAPMAGSNPIGTGGSGSNSMAGAMAMPMAGSNAMPMGTGGTGTTMPDATNPPIMMGDYHDPGTGEWEKVPEDKVGEVCKMDINMLKSTGITQSFAESSATASSATSPASTARATCSRAPRASAASSPGTCSTWCAMCEERTRHRTVP